MDDSFSLFAQRIRQNKINKDEIQLFRKEIIEFNPVKNISIKKAIQIQKIVRGFLYRKKFKHFLEEINIKTVIEYLHEKRRLRIHNDSNRIISFFLNRYLRKYREIKIKKELDLQYKIHCSNLIKARLKGIIIRKKIKKQLNNMKRMKKKIMKNILSYKVRLILSCENIQNILNDIANIKTTIKNKNNIKEIKELKIQLSQNINLFYDTYYSNKNNKNWIQQKKTKEKWVKKYFDMLGIKIPESPIIIKKSLKNSLWNSGKNLHGKENGNDKYFLDFYSDSEEDIDLVNNLKYNKNSKTEKRYIINKESAYGEEFTTQEENNFNNISKHKSVAFNEKKIKVNNIRKNNHHFIQNADLNDINLYSKISNGKDTTIEYNNNNSVKKSMTNKYQLREERPIKSMRDYNFLECDNPFGLKEKQQYPISSDTIKKLKTRQSTKSSSQLNNEIIPFNKEEINNNNINIIKSKNNNNNFKNREERPIGGRKNIDYGAMFGEDGEVNFEGDPFGGAKQFTTDKSKIQQHKTYTNTSKRPVYDARKAIEEAKLKEANEVKKEKHTEFRDFLREMKKANAKNKENEKEKEKENIKNKKNEINNGMNNNKKSNKKENSNNKNDEEIVAERLMKNSLINSTNDINIRKKLQKLEKPPVQVSNYKDVKSKIECWTTIHCGTKKNIEFPNKIKTSSQKNLSNENLYNYCPKRSSVEKKPNYERNNGRLLKPTITAETIEKYIDKKLASFYRHIDKIEEEFNFDKYFDDKEEKMSNYPEIPFIGDDSIIFNKIYTNEEYDKLFEEINEEYIKLK